MIVFYSIENSSTFYSRRTKCLVFDIIHLEKRFDWMRENYLFERLSLI